MNLAGVNFLIYTLLVLLGKYFIQKYRVTLLYMDYLDEMLLREDELVNDVAKRVEGLGDYGRKIEVYGQTKVINEMYYRNYSVYLDLADHLSFNRKPPDIRNFNCRNKFYKIWALPSASVIIIFHNENFSILMRTVHSVLNTGNLRLLKEIILVDDGSTWPELQSKLDYYIGTRLSNKVKLIRMPKRSGLIRARLAGARIATADVLVFLDAHCECGEYWLEPLVERIKLNRTTVVTPLIDNINDKHFEYNIHSPNFMQVRD